MFSALEIGFCSFLVIKNNHSTVLQLFLIQGFLGVHAGTRLSTCQRRRTDKKYIGCPQQWKGNYIEGLSGILLLLQGVVMLSSKSAWGFAKP